MRVGSPEIWFIQEIKVGWGLGKRKSKSLVGQSLIQNVVLSQE